MGRSKWTKRDYLMRWYLIWAQFLLLRAIAGSSRSLASTAAKVASSGGSSVMQLENSFAGSQRTKPPPGPDTAHPGSRPPRLAARMDTTESAWLLPCVVLVINDNLYGLCLYWAPYRLCPYALLDLHLLESRLRGEDYMLIKAKSRLINTWVQVKVCQRVLLPYWCMGEWCM